MKIGYKWVIDLRMCVFDRVYVSVHKSASVHACAYALVLMRMCLCACTCVCILCVYARVCVCVRALTLHAGEGVWAGVV